MSPGSPVKSLHLPLELLGCSHTHTHTHTHNVCEYSSLIDNASFPKYLFQFIPPPAIYERSS